MKKKKPRSGRQTLKAQVWRWCAKYIKLRDAIDDLSITNDLSFVVCRTCGTWIKTKTKNAQASHFIPRGSGGGSGVYFDERNIHICCSQCNRFKQGNPVKYREFMLKTYGQAVIDELELKDRTHTYTLMELEGLKFYYKQAYEELK